MAAPIFRIDAPRPMQDTTAGIRGALNYFAQIRQNNIANKRADEAAALDKARLDLQDKRYEADKAESKRRFDIQQQNAKKAIARAEQAKLDAIDKEIMLTGEAPINFDTTKKYVKKTKIGTANVYDTDKINLDLKNNPELFADKEKKFDLEKISDKDVALENAWERIQLDPSYKNPYEKKEALKTWMEQNGYSHIVKEEDIGITKLGKTLAEPIANSFNYLLKIRNKLNPWTTDRIDNKFYYDEKRKIKNAYTIDDVETFANEKISALKTARDKNAKREKMNAEIEKRNNENRQKILDTYDTGSTADVIKYKDDYKAVPQKEVYKAINEEKERRLAELESQKLDKKTKKYKQLAIMREAKNAKTLYQSEVRKSTELKEFKAKEDYRNELKIKRKEAEVALELAKNNGNDAEIKKAELELKKQDIAYKKALTEKINRELD